MTPDARAADLAALAWQIELGADEAIGEAPVDRFEPKTAPPSRPCGRAGRCAPQWRRRRRRPWRPAPGRRSWPPACADLAALRAALGGFEGSALRLGRAQPRSSPTATRGRGLMVVGEAPGRDEDRPGCPSSGARGSSSTGCSRRSGCRGRAADPARGGLYHQRAAVAAAAEPRPVGRRGGAAAAVPLPPHRAGAPGGPAAARLAGGARGARHRRRDHPDARPLARLARGAGDRDLPSRRAAARRRQEARRLGGPPAARRRGSMADGRALPAGQDRRADGVGQPRRRRRPLGRHCWSSG